MVFEGTLDFHMHRPFFRMWTVLHLLLLITSFSTYWSYRSCHCCSETPLRHIGRSSMHSVTLFDLTSHAVCWTARLIHRLCISINEAADRWPSLLAGRDRRPSSAAVRQQKLKLARRRTWPFPRIHRCQQRDELRRRRGSTAGLLFFQVGSAFYTDATQHGNYQQRNEVNLRYYIASSYVRRWTSRPRTWSPARNSRTNGRP
jgi:hypothetical protein